MGKAPGCHIHMVLFGQCNSEFNLETYYFISRTTSIVRITPQSFLALSFNPFATMLQMSIFTLNLNKDHPLKNPLFLSNTYKIEVTITSLIKMLELTNFCHMTISKIYFKIPKSFLISPLTNRRLRDFKGGSLSW